MGEILSEFGSPNHNLYIKDKNLSTKLHQKRNFGQILKKNSMKFLVLFSVIYAIYKYSTLISQASSLLKKKKEQIKPLDDNDDGEYVDYEEVED